ncbi:hypothetical protein C3941_18650 [Kaistia algarum]|nr:DUF167 family protein [Kaistia algarum]PPE78351.1 hypothetical protein C3941_18650 [Kaistia algarum]
MTSNPYRIVSGALRLDVRLTPKGGRDRVDGVGTLADGRCVVLARVSAPPDKGAANRALERLIADWLDVARSSVRIVTGDTARIKTLSVEVGDDVLSAAVAGLPRTG